MRLWKVLGAAGLAGVAATGVAVARAERHRRAYEPDAIRERLHERYAEAMRVEAAATAPQPADHRASRSWKRAWLRRPRRRRR